MTDAAGDLAGQGTAKSGEPLCLRGRPLPIWSRGAPPAMRTSDLTHGRTTAFLQIVLPVLLATSALGRLLVGALLNAAYKADDRVRGRILLLLDEVARLGYMQLIEQARDGGRKNGIACCYFTSCSARWTRSGAARASRPGTIAPAGSYSPRHQGVDAPVGPAWACVDRKHLHGSVCAGMPRHPPLFRSRLDGGHDPVGDALVDVDPGSRSAGYCCSCPISLFLWLQSSALEGTYFPGPRERWGWRGKAASQGHGCTEPERNAGEGSWVEAALGERRGNALSVLLSRVRGSRATLSFALILTFQRILRRPKRTLIRQCKLKCAELNIRR